MEATAAGYPEGVIELLDKNPATVSYVEDYGEKQGQIYAEDIGDDLCGWADPASDPVG